MKHLFLKLLVLVIGFAYTSSVFELDKEECKQNYEKENHSYITCVKTVDNSTSHFDTPLELETFFVNIQPVYFVFVKSLAFSSFINDDPPDKLYLLHSSLLI